MHSFFGWLQQSDPIACFILRFDCLISKHHAEQNHLLSFEDKKILGMRIPIHWKNQHCKWYPYQTSLRFTWCLDDILLFASIMQNNMRLMAHCSSCSSVHHQLWPSTLLIRTVLIINVVKCLVVLLLSCMITVYQPITNPLESYSLHHYSNVNFLQLIVYNRFILFRWQVK